MLPDQLKSWNKLPTLSGGWPAQAGIIPDEAAVAIALRLGAPLGKKYGLAWVMFCRPHGATRVEINSACENPQYVEAAKLQEAGRADFMRAKRPDGTTTHLLGPAGSRRSCPGAVRVGRQRNVSPSHAFTAPVELPKGLSSQKRNETDPALPSELFRSGPPSMATEHEPHQHQAGKYERLKHEYIAANGVGDDRNREIESEMKEVFSMTKIKLPAARVRQGDLVLYATALRVQELVSEGFYSVETLDPEDQNDKGFQRLLNVARAKKLADYIVKGQDRNDAFLPTSIFLATDKSIDFDEQTHTIEFDRSLIGPFSVVDGQHRLEGLKMAAQKDSRVLDFEVPVNIAIRLPKIHQMCHFLIVNSTQKSVDKSVEQRIIARLTEALDVEDLPSLPGWILRTVERGEVDKAIKYVDYLNETEDSPWFGKIRMANSDSVTATINQRSFLTAVVKYVLTSNNPISIVKDFEKEKKIFLNYWKAVQLSLDDGDLDTLYKYGGVELFCKFSIPFFMKLQDRGNYTVPTMEKLLKSCFENVEGEYAGVGHPDWWKTGGQAGRLNSGALNFVCQEMSRALHRVSTGAPIEL